MSMCVFHLGCVNKTHMPKLMNFWQLSMPCDVTTSFFIETASFHNFMSARNERLCVWCVCTVDIHIYTTHPLQKPQCDWQARNLRYINRCSFRYHFIYHIVKMKYISLRADNKRKWKEKKHTHSWTPHVLCVMYGNSSKRKTCTHSSKHKNSRESLKQSHAYTSHLLHIFSMYAVIVILTKKKKMEYLDFGLYGIWRRWKFRDRILPRRPPLIRWFIIEKMMGHFSNI